MESKQQQIKSTVVHNSPSLLDLPNEILLNIVFFMIGDESGETIDGKAIRTMALVSKRMNKCIIKNLYENFLPALQKVFILPKYKRQAPRTSLYLIISGTEVMDKDGSGGDDFLALIEKKKYRDLEYLMPAYGITRDRTAIKTFLCQQIHRLLDEFATEIDTNKEQAKKKDSKLFCGYRSRIRGISCLSAGYWCAKEFFPKRKEIGKRFMKIALARESKSAHNL